MPRILPGESVQLAGTILANTETTLTFSRAISRMRMIYNSNIDLYVKFNGGLTVVRGGQPNTFNVSGQDLYFQRSSRIESIFEIDGITIIRLSFFRATQLVLPNNSLRIIGWG